MNLTPWDVQSKQIYTINGVAPTLYSGKCRWGGSEAYIFDNLNKGEKMFFAFQRFGEYKESEVASTLKQRDYKDATDLIVREGGDELKDVSAMYLRRLTPL